MREIVFVDGNRFALNLQPGFGFSHQSLFFFECDFAEEDSGPQEDKIGVEHVTATVVVDGDNFSGFVHPLDL